MLAMNISKLFMMRKFVEPLRFGSRAIYYASRTGNLVSSNFVRPLRFGAAIPNINQGSIRFYASNTKHLANLKSTGFQICKMVLTGACIYPFLCLWHRCRSKEEGIVSPEWSPVSENLQEEIFFKKKRDRFYNNPKVSVAITSESINQHLRRFHFFTFGDLIITFASAAALSRISVITTFYKASPFKYLFGAFIASGLLGIDLVYDHGLRKNALFSFLYEASTAFLYVPMILLGWQTVFKATCYSIGVFGGLSVFALNEYITLPSLLEDYYVLFLCPLLAAYLVPSKTRGIAMIAAALTFFDQGGDVLIHNSMLCSGYAHLREYLPLKQLTFSIAILLSLKKPGTLLRPLILAISLI